MFEFLKKAKSNEVLIGVEFKADGIAIAQVSYDPGQLPRLNICESINLNSDASSALSPDDITKAYKSATNKIKSRNFSVNVALEQDERQLLLIEAPQVELSEMNEATRWKIKDMIDFDVDEAIIDVIEIPNIKELKRNPMIYAVVVKREKINNVIAQCGSCGSDLSIIDIPDMAQRNFAALLPEDQNGVAVLSINSKNSLLTITRKGELYLSRELDTGFEHLLSSVQKTNTELDVDSEVNPKPESMLKSLERMVLEVQRSLDYYESQYSQPQINALFLAPFSYDVPEIKDYFSTQLGLKTKILDFNVLFSTNNPLSHQLQAATFYAVGAALR